MAHAVYAHRSLDRSRRAEWRIKKQNVQKRTHTLTHGRVYKINTFFVFYRERDNEMRLYDTFKSQFRTKPYAF